MNNVLQSINQLSNKQLFAYAMGIVSIFICASILFEQPILSFIPFVFVGAAFIIWDYRILYILFLITIPYSIEIYLPNGLGTDLPSEPIMLAITGIAILIFVNKFREIDYSYVYHPITIFMLLHICWIGITSIGASYPIVSFKYWLAKLWYIIPFFFMPFKLIKSHKESKRAIYLLMVPLLIAVLWVLVRHAGHDFSFRTSNEVVYPIFRNHVNYAAILVIFLPYVFALRQIETRNRQRKLLLSLALLILIVGIYFSYTRAAQASIIIAIGAYWMVKWKLTKPAVVIGVIGLIVGVGYLIKDKKYLDYAPNFQTTVSHFNYDNLLAATYKLEDISTMERVHRWVAGGRMLADKPILGFGPANFYNTYRDYTLNEFKTYVSNNPEKSGIHNYYLMIAVEQGIIGLIIFLGLLIAALVRGEKLYHRMTDQKSKAFVMAALISIVVSCAILLINDMLEADKVGPIFFFSLSVLVAYDVIDKRRYI